MIKFSLMTRIIITTILCFSVWAGFITLKIDSCLDDGGSWNYQQGECQLPL